MIPENAKTHEEAIEALIAASLRAPDREPEITEQEIRRYVDQLTTLSADDEEALEKSKPSVKDTIKKILQGGQREKSSCTSSKETSMDRMTKGSERHSGASDEFVEAVLISQLTRLLSSPEYPLGRFRCNKFGYFSHRRAEEEVNQHFLKKAAGPYSPWARYQGPEGIALKNGYVRRAAPRGGLLPGDKIDNITPYLSHYAVCRAIDWVVAQFRYSKNEELELLATVDFAALDLKRIEAAITPDAVKRVISENKEWAPKLERAVFSDENIQRALDELRPLFPATYGLD